MIARLLRAAVRDVLALAGRRLDRKVCRFANTTHREDDE